MADKVYLKKQSVHRGKAGYRGDPDKIVVIDPDTGQPVKGHVTKIGKHNRLRPRTLTETE